MNMLSVYALIFLSSISGGIIGALVCQFMRRPTRVHVSGRSSRDEHVIDVYAREYARRRGHPELFGIAREKLRLIADFVHRR